MGRSHSMSGAAVALTAIALGVGPVAASNAPLSVIALATAVVAGGALLPDIDSHGSTVVRSFGIFGKAFYEIINALSLLVHNMTRSKADNPKDNGHRTLMHTPIMAVLIGLLITGISILPGTVDIAGRTYAWGQIGSLVVLWVFLHLAFAGLFDTFIIKARQKFGPYLLMVGSLILTILIALTLPQNQTYPWLGLLAGFGMFIHLLGDMITKAGVPMLWPLKIRGKRWYDVATPSFMRIKAGGGVETAFLFPLFVGITVVAVFFCLPFANPWLHQWLGW